MKVLISQRQIQNKYGDWMDCLENNYTTFLEDKGFELITVPNATLNITNFLNSKKFYGIVLTGGENINPFYYGGKTKKNSYSKDRDRIELSLLNYAVNHRIPVLGICRGMQLLNIYFKGKLIQNIALIDNNKTHKAVKFHRIKIVNSEISINLKNNFIDVNSYHNQGVTLPKLGENLKPFAIFEELNLVEGLFHKSLPIAGIQWHPERSNTSKLLDDLIFDGFLNKKLFWK